MQNEQGLVSVIIPTKNRKELVGKAVESALDQTYRNLEVIVVDDGSEPPLNLDIEDGRLKIIRIDSSVGGAAARNIGFRVAKGNYLCLLDDDDYYYQNKVMCQLEYLKQHPDVDMVFSQLCRDDKQGNVCIAPPSNYSFDPMTNFYWPNKMHNNSTLFKRRVLDTVKFDERLSKYQDWQFNMSISLHYKVHYLPICVGMWYRDKRSDRLALQDDFAKFKNFRIICEIFSDVIDNDARLRQKYYRRLGYLALKSNDWQCAKASFSKLNVWRKWPSFAMALLRSGGSAMFVNARQRYTGLQGQKNHV